MKTVLLAAALAAATVSLTGCRDSTGSDGTATGSMTFSFAGARSGTFSTNGAFRDDSRLDKNPFAAGRELLDQTSQLGGLIEVMAYAPVTESRGTWVFFLLPPVSAGQTLDLNCVDYTTFCPSGLVVFNFDLAGPTSDSDGFRIYSGTVKITSVSGGRLRGTFSGTAQAYDDQRQITVAGGSFDVPLL
jgi:hypothetical protein